MSSPISPIRHVPMTDAGQPATRTGKSAEFARVLQDSIRSVENVRTEADQAVEQFLSGEQEDTHSVALAAQRAELTMDLFLQVRNKVIQAYQEVMRMQM